MNEQSLPTKLDERPILWPEQKQDIPGPRVAWPVWEVPGFRTQLALERKCADNLLFILWGGIGDQLCSEPTLRYALEYFKDCKISIATDYPEMFQHLKFTEVFNTKNCKPDISKYLILKTITIPTDLSWQFMSHCITHCVDFPSLAALRCQLPIRFKAVEVNPPAPTDERLLNIINEKDQHVLIHAGKHWESKTFPVEWWNAVVKSVADKGFVPVLIGKTVDHNVGFVNCNHEKAIDLRDQSSLSDTLWLCKNAELMICSDSSPLHMAVTGQCKIAFICSAKHQDYIYHWRKNFDGNIEWAWRMKHFNLGGMWDIMDTAPNKDTEQVVDKVDVEILKTWLPKPEAMIEWLSLYS